VVRLYRMLAGGAMQVDPASVAATAIAKILDTLRKHAFSFFSTEHFLSHVDQAVVSLTGFFTTVLIARGGGSRELGIYALALSVALSAVGFQESLILQPYLIQKFYPEGTCAERAGASLALSIIIAAVSLLVLTIAAIGFSEWHAPRELVVMTWAIAGMLPFALMRDFVRRLAFAHRDADEVLLLDLAAATIQLSAIGWLAASGRISAVSAFAALGVASAFPTAIWLCQARSEFMIRVPHVRVALKRTWATGKLLAAGRITKQGWEYITYWLAAAIGGAAVTGAYAACMNIVNLASPLMVGITNTVMPKSVMAWKHGGGPGLRHQSIRSSALIVALVVPLILTAMLAGETVMRFLFGAEFDGLGHILTVLVAALSARTLGLPASNALAAMERTRAIVTLDMLEGVLTLGLIWILMTELRLPGAAYGLLAGGVAGAISRWVTFFMGVPRVCDPAHVVRVLKELTKVSDESRWAITRIGEGHESEVFVVNSTGREPLWRTHRTLVAKLYKPVVRSSLAKITLENVQAQFNSLSERHAALNGRKVSGWRISVPQPLYLCQSPLALVMTAVPGQNIDSYLANKDAPTPEILLEAARAVAMAMQECWSRGQLHGDLGLHNVLLDVGSKEISFIDAEASHTCNDDSQQFNAASDLAHFLKVLAMDLADLTRNPTVRMNKELFAEGVLRAITEKIECREENRRVLGEIWFCAREELANYVDDSWSPRGLWQRLVKLVATHRIRSILQRVEPQVNITNMEKIVGLPE
jgi:O-antigen/teichoic acid export membrane protein/RIO-like serine/threonine protein kinase